LCARGGSAYRAQRTVRGRAQCPLFCQTMSERRTGASSRRASVCRSGSAHGASASYATNQSMAFASAGSSSTFVRWSSEGRMNQTIWDRRMKSVRTSKHAMIIVAQLKPNDRKSDISAQANRSVPFPTVGKAAGRRKWTGPSCRENSVPMTSASRTRAINQHAALVKAPHEAFRFDTGVMKLPADVAPGWRSNRTRSRIANLRREKARRS
jgi:hypothetical protein